MTLTDIPMLFVPSGVVSMGLGLLIAPLVSLCLVLLVSWRVAVRRPRPFTGCVFVVCGVPACFLCGSWSYSLQSLIALVLAALLLLGEVAVRRLWPTHGSTALAALGS